MLVTELLGVPTATQDRHCHSWWPLSSRARHQPFGSFQRIFPPSFLLLTLEMLREATISKPWRGGSPRGGTHHAEM